MQFSIKDILVQASEQKADYLYLVTGAPPICRQGKKLLHFGEEPLGVTDLDKMINGIYTMASNRQRIENSEDVFSFAIPEQARFCVNIYKQRASYAATIRIVPLGLPDYKALGIPEDAMDVIKLKKGIIVVCGESDIATSEFIACLVDKMNNEQERFILTLEDPIKYLHRHNQSIIAQREIGIDYVDVHKALESTLQQNADVVIVELAYSLNYLKEIMEIAETGHLVLMRINATSLEFALDKAISAIPEGQRSFVKNQLANLLKRIVMQTQQTEDGKRVTHYEIYSNKQIADLLEKYQS